MVLNSKSSTTKKQQKQKNKNKCLQDKKIYPVKLSGIFVIHQSKWIISMSS